MTPMGAVTPTAGVEVVRHAWIPTRDGTRLAARLWLPETAGVRPAGALLEYIPYRKNDMTAFRDAGLHLPFAARGFASVRVDLRGSGDSEGILDDEYSPRELADALDVIEWLASQPWCNGSVGMFGKSWGGFNSLQVAALRPPALKAIITVCSSDDRYGTDVHYMGGALLASEMVSWATTMLAYNGRPPDPTVVGEAWREIWLQRLHRTPWLLEPWLAHQSRDAYWEHGSVGDDYSAMSCAVLAVGGWADPYCDTVFRLLDGYDGPCKGIVGPWAHFYPNDGAPGPAVEFIDEACRWWRRWLLDEPNDVMEVPDARLWLQDYQMPDRAGQERTGRFVGVPDWADRPEPTRLQLAGAGSADRHLDADLRCGAAGGRWYVVMSGDLPADQRADDAWSAVVESDVLESDLCLVGFPEVTLTVSAPAPDGQICVRLGDVSPDGPVALVSIGVLNLTHRDSHADPSPIVPGETMRLRLRLRACGYRLQAGHRLRVSVSAAYWPWLWPSAGGAGVDLHLSQGVEVALPVISEAAFVDAGLVIDESAKVERERGGVELRAPGQGWRRSTEDEHGRLTIIDRRDGSSEIFVVDSGLSFTQEQEDRFEADNGDPLSARAATRFAVTLERPGWSTRVEGTMEMTATETEWLVTGKLEAFEGDRRIFGEARSLNMPRLLL